MAPGRSVDMTRRTALYRLYDNADALLYVGIAFNPRTRWYDHANRKAWWGDVARREVAWYPTRRAAEAAELEAIRSERPRYNISGADDPVTVPDRPRRARPHAGVALARELKRAGRAYMRARRRRDEASARLGATIRSAAAAGLGPAEITRLIEHRLTEKTVSRIIREGA